MSKMEETIKNETDKIVEQFKKRFEAEGIPFEGMTEVTFRSGIQNGICVAALALLSAPVDVCIVDQENK